MKSNLLLILILTFCWNQRTRSYTHDTNRTRFKNKLHEFAKCASGASRSKPLEVIKCLEHMKLESDLYWNVMVKNDQAHLDMEESDFVAAIKVFQEINAILESKHIDEDLNWNQVKQIIKSETSSSGDGPYEGSGSYSRDYTYHYDDDEGSGGYPDQEGSGRRPKGILENLDVFIEDWNTLLTMYKGGHHTEEPSQDPCTEPFVDVAYKVCILPVFDRQLSWHDAHQYCKHRGLELAMDSGVIKGRKHFNYQLGLPGTRERWTLWVGGRISDEGNWKWNDGTTLPNFFWSKNEPRVYGQDSTPAGTCMAIHGFTEYYGVALPCHYKRRFVCQKI